METETGVTCYNRRMLRIVSNPWERGEARKDSTLQPLEGMWTSQHFDFGLGAFRNKIKNTFLWF